MKNFFSCQIGKLKLGGILSNVKSEGFLEKILKEGVFIIKQMRNDV